MKALPATIEGRYVVMRSTRLRCACVAAALLLGASAASADACAPKEANPVDAILQMYAGLMAGDRAKTLAAFDQAGFMFDGGARFTPEALTDLIIKREAAGDKFLWRVDEPESHTSCDTAWAAWINRGTFTTGSRSDPKTWLESAFFVWRDGAWKIRFFHSTPVRPQP